MRLADVWRGLFAFLGVFGAGAWVTMPSDDRRLLIRNRDSGFFSNFNQVINNLYYRLGREGIVAASVDWRLEPELQEFPYGNREDGNLWLQFFEPLPFDRLPDEQCETRVFADETMTARLAYAMYKLNWRWRWGYHRVFHRFIRIKPHVLERVDAIHRKHMAGRHCIGVHYRHPAHDRECINPIPEPDVFISRIRRMLPLARPWSVFLATDFEPAVHDFRRAFGEHLVLQPGVRRSENLVDGHMHHDNRTPGLTLGEQVLVDCLLLAHCDLLIHVTSNVATAAGYINPRMKMQYCETKLQAVLGYFWSAAVIGKLYFLNWYGRLPLGLRKFLRRYVIPVPVFNWVSKFGQSGHELR